jgi:hypothetical protein
METKINLIKKITADFLEKMKVKIDEFEIIEEKENIYFIKIKSPDS